MPLAVRWSSGVDEIAALEPAWRELEPSATRRTPMGGCDYLVPWYRHHAGRAGEPLLGSAWEGRTLVGLAPLVVRRARLGGVPVRTVQFAAAGGEAGEFLLPDDRPDLSGVFLESLLGAVRFDLARFNNLQASSEEVAALRRAAGDRGLALETVPTSYATVDLSHGYDAYRRGLGAKFRGNLKRRSRALEAQGPVAVEGVHFESDARAIESGLARLFAISDRSWKARRGGPMAPHHRAFFAEVARRFGAQGRLDLALLTLGGRDRAYMLGVADRGVYFDVTLSYDDAVRHLAPGVFLTQEVLRRLAARGIHTFVSHGVHDYKRHFATEIVARQRALVFARSPRARLSRALRFSLAPLWSRLGLLRNA
jgi:CelD/BcsL family acetyltransferase involved in cellulose biosynthesis